MTSIGIGLLAFTDHSRKLYEIIPDDLRKTWNEWALQGLILISIASQIVLALLGNLRKHNPRTRIRIILWCAYLLANAVAIAALGVITRTALDASSSGSCPSISKHDQKLKNTSELMYFWAPFLLLHLGGPDTISAYSLEDNEIWLRHLLELVFQSGVALHILLLSLPGCSRLPMLSVFVYVAGFIKIFERVQALRLANTERLRDSMLDSPDPGPNYPKLVEEFQLKKSQGFVVKIDEVPEAPPPVNEDYAYPEDQSKVVSNAYRLFQAFKRLFVDLILTFEDRDSSHSYFQRLEFREAFSVIEIELGFAYDMFYTKASVVYTITGFICRVTSFLLIVVVLVGFPFLCYKHKYHYQHIDTAITYLLSATAFITEFFAAYTMLRSDWTENWFSQMNYTRNVLIFPFLKQPTKLRWSNSIGQLDLLSVSLEERPPKYLQAQKLLGIDQYRTKHRYKTYSKVSDELKDLIYKQFLDFMKHSSDPKSLCSHKGSFSLGNTDLLWSITEVDFDQSILIWNIATSLCYYSEAGPDQDVCRTESKHISDYLLYLLVTYPVMLPIGIGMIRYRDTCAEAMRFFKEKEPIIGKKDTSIKLLQVKCNELLPSQESEALLFPSHERFPFQGIFP